MRSLHFRLLAVLSAILLPAGALLVVTALGTARTYHHEVTQRQNSDLAGNLLADGADLDGDLAAADVDDLIKMMAMANPGVEIYLLDELGRVIRAPAGVTIEADRVDLRAVARFLEVAEEGHGYPVLGTDPRRGGRVIFAAAPLPGGHGFLYVVLTDEARASLLRSVQGSATLRLVAWGGGVGLIVVLLVGAWAFALLTRRLRRLDAAVRGFDPAGGPIDAPDVDHPRDEIDALAAGFAALGARVRAQITALEDADRARRELITNVSHDLRTPLAALQAALEVAQAAPDVGPADTPDPPPGAVAGAAPDATPPTADAPPSPRDQHLTTARRNADRLARQVDQLFQLSTLDGAEPPMRLEDFPPADLIHDVAQKFAPRAAASGVTLHVDVASPLRFVRGDLGLVERALSNLIDNALRHAPPGGNVTLTALRVGDRTRLEVRDDGEGLDPALHERVFERFFRGERARAGEGAGLGLAIVRRVAELHGGVAGVASEPGLGARFWIDLPTRPPAEV